MEKDGKERLSEKTLVTIRIDADILEYLRSTGSGWQSRVSDYIKEEVEAERL